MRYFNSVVTAGLLFSSLAPVRADAPAQKPAVSFSPAIINFGVVPSHQQPTQLVTVTFDRRVFSPDHLPTLQPDRLSTDAEVSLFARFDEPDSIRVVYRVTVHADQGGLIRDMLVLTTDKALWGGRPIILASGSAEIPVLAAIISSLTAAPGVLDFGSVTCGGSKSLKLEIGYFGPGLARAYTDVNRKADAEERRDLAQLAAEFPENTLGLASTTVSSSSPLVTAQYFTKSGLNGSVWQVWIATFNSRLPLGRDRAELQFKTQDGYCVTVPVTAEVTAPVKPEPHALKKH